MIENHDVVSEEGNVGCHVMSCEPLEDTVVNRMLHHRVESIDDEDERHTREGVALPEHSSIIHGQSKVVIYKNS